MRNEVLLDFKNPDLNNIAENVGTEKLCGLNPEKRESFLSKLKLVIVSEMYHLKWKVS